MAKPEAELKKAIKKGDLESVRRILADGLPIDSELPAKVTGLEFALAREQGEIVWELLRNGAKPRKQKNDNLLLDAAKFRDLELIRCLIERGADVHASDRQQQTPLLGAAAAGYYDAVRFLLDQGADPRARTKNGQSAFQLASRTRTFCRGLLPSADGEVADLFRAQLEDLDRIEELLQQVLTAKEVSELRGDETPAADHSTCWDLNDVVEFQLDVTPFPFSSRQASRLDGRLGRRAEPSWSEHFSAEGQLLFRVSAAFQSGDPLDGGSWTPFAPCGLVGRFLRFTGEAQLPAGRAIIEIRLDSTWELFAGELVGWEIDVQE